MQMARGRHAVMLTVLTIISAAALVSASEKPWWRRMLIEWPEVSFVPGWTSLPWGPSPDWDLVHRTVECHLDMRKQLVDITRPCAAEPELAPCKLKVKLVGLHAHEYIKNEGGRFDFAKETSDLKEKYCRRWGFCESTVLMEPEFGPEFKAKERAASWHKVLAVMQEVAKGDFDWYMWLDGDAAFIDHSLDLRWLIARWTMPEFGGDAAKTFLVSKDIWFTPGNGGSNMGVWLIRNGTQSLEFLKELWEVPDKVESVAHNKQDHPWEQLAFNEVMYDKFKDHVERLPECWLFGHPLSLIDTPFVAHLCGIANHHKQQERLRYFSFYNSRYH